MKASSNAKRCAQATARNNTTATAGMAMAPQRLVTVSHRTARCYMSLRHPHRRLDSVVVHDVGDAQRVGQPYAAAGHDQGPEGFVALAGSISADRHRHVDRRLP